MGETHKIELELPDPPAVPDLTPQISDIRERLARVEERTINPVADPAAAESLALASEAHRRVVALEEKLASAVELASAPAESEVLNVPPPPPPPPTPEPEPEVESESHEHLPWFNPLRYL